VRNINGNEQQSIEERLALIRTNGIYTVSTERGKLISFYLFSDVLLDGDLYLTLGGETGAFKLWATDSTNGVPLAVSGQTTTNNMPHTFATKGTVTQVWLEVLKSGPCEITYGFVGTNNAAGINFTDTITIMAVKLPVVEPITFAPGNPALLAKNDTGGYSFTIDSSIPHNNIVWSAINNLVTIVGPATGTNVTVQAGNTEGLSGLTASVNGIQLPTLFNINVVTLSNVNVSVWVVCNSNGVPCVSGTQVSTMITQANEKLRHKAVALQWSGSIQYTNRQDWLAFPNSTAAHTSMMYLPHNGNGLKVVFINQINSGATGFCGTYLIGITTNAIATTTPHEVGHAGGLKDSYDQRNDGAIVTGPVASGRMDAKDWGAGYYSDNLQQEALIPRLLMYGYMSETKGYIPHGDVYGLPVQGTATMIKVGFDGLNRQPVHPPPPPPP